MVYPFLALVGQREMRLALMLGLVNPNVGGVLLIGPRGTGKTTAVRSLTDLLPPVSRSLCPYGCLPEDVQAGGQDAICPDCARRYAQGESLVYQDRVRLIELPLNARIEDVVGGLDERAAIHSGCASSRGLLARADQNLLYVDEVNLLGDEIVDAILDAAAQGNYTVQRGPLAAVYRARFVLIGSMNPEEGRLRPQILDRFGLRVVVRGLEEQTDRMEAYRRSVSYRASPRAVAGICRRDAGCGGGIAHARAALPATTISPAGGNPRPAFDQGDGDRSRCGLRSPCSRQPGRMRSPTGAARPKSTTSARWPRWRCVCAGRSSWSTIWASSNRKTTSCRSSPSPAAAAAAQARSQATSRRTQTGRPKPAQAGRADRVQTFFIR